MIVFYVKIKTSDSQYQQTPNEAICAETKICLT